jgi:carbamoyltransferase
MTTWVLGLGFSHDASGYLLADGEPVAGVQLERLTRRKHDHRLSQAKLLVDYLTTCAGVLLRDIDAIGVSAPYLTSSDQLRAAPIDLTAPNVLHVGHHLAHAYSAFGPSSFEDAAVVVVDGHGDAYYERNEDMLLPGPERTRQLDRVDAAPPDTRIPPRFEAESTYYFTRSGTQLLKRAYLQFGRRISTTYGWADTLGIGLNYGDVATWLFGSRHASGKVMGLAPWAHGRPLDLPSAFQIHDGEAILDDRWKGLIRSQLEGSPDLRHDREWAAGLAAYVQDATEALMLHLVRHALQIAPSRKLCLAGGVALNATTNGRIQREMAGDQLFIQPASSDAGLSIGAALAADHLLAGEIRGRQPLGDSLGRRYSSVEAKEAITVRAGAKAQVVQASNPISVVAEALADGRVVGWFQGGSEFGPRALGHRSILADPRRQGMRDHLNTRVKRRESFRPFAPAVLEEHATAWFLGTPTDAYMLTTAFVSPDKAGRVPAITHVDGSARIQVVPRSQGVYGLLLEEFHRLTGVPMLVNTSFNAAGQPIVETPAHAVDAFMEMELDLLWLDGVCLTKR